MSKTVPCYSDCLPQYDSCQPNQDLLTSVIENEHTFRVVYQRLDDLNRTMEKFEKNTPRSANGNYVLSSKLFLELSGFFLEGFQITTELANITKERTIQNTQLYTAMSRLTVSEFNSTYASLKRGQNQQIRHELAEESERVEDTPAKPVRSFGREFKNI